MKILAHRGLWHSDEDKNSVEAMKRAFDNGFGIETDIRDYNGDLVISHDIPNGDKLLSFESFLKIYSKYPGFPLALNIKSDGLQKLLLSQLSSYSINNYFVFDMSIPDTINYLNLQINCFTRQSEIEKDPLLYESATGIWLDSFKSTWFDEDLINNHVKNGKIVAIVSPELHK